MQSAFCIWYQLLSSLPQMSRRTSVDDAAAAQAAPGVGQVGGWAGGTGPWVCACKGRWGRAGRRVLPAEQYQELCPYLGTALPPECHPQHRPPHQVSIEEVKAVRAALARQQAQEVPEDERWAVQVGCLHTCFTVPDRREISAQKMEPAWKLRSSKGPASARVLAYPE